MYYSEVEYLALSQGAQIRYKDESRFMRLLAKVLFFNKGFLTKYTTTIGSTIYLPSRAAVEADLDGYAAVLAHELVHVMDARAQGSLVFGLSYLFPQCLSLLSLLALLSIPGSIWWLTSLSALLCLAPWPSTGRAAAEYRGYGMSLATSIWRGHRVDHIPQRMIEQFTGPSYYWMDRDTTRVVETLRAGLDEVQAGTCDLPLADDLRRIFSEHAT